MSKNYNMDDKGENVPVNEFRVLAFKKECPKKNLLQDVLF